MVARQIAVRAASAGTLVLMLGLAGVPAVEAQQIKPRVVEFGKKAAAQPVAQPAAKPAAQPARQAQPEAPFALIRAVHLVAARELADTSFDSFQRGLMPLRDHLDQLDTAWQSERLAAQNGLALHAIDVAHVERIGRAVTALEEFNQPASNGWSAELLLAQALHAEARSFVAAGEGFQSVADSERARAVELAGQHLDQRHKDGTGFAILPVFRNGVFTPTLVTFTVNEPQISPEAFLSDAIALSHTWAMRSREVGGASLETLTAYEQARVELRAALAGNNTTAAKQLLARAEEAATALFQQQREYYDAGTASLFDLTTAWRLREDVYQMVAAAPDSKVALTNAALIERSSLLRGLAERAVNVSDPVGRIHADVRAVSLIDAVDRDLVESQRLAEKRRLTAAAAAAASAAAAKKNSPQPNAPKDRALKDAPAK